MRDLDLVINNMMCPVELAHEVRAVRVGAYRGYGALLEQTIPLHACRNRSVMPVSLTDCCSTGKRAERSCTRIIKGQYADQGGGSSS